MADFLSDEWFDAFAEALESVSVDTDPPLLVAQRIESDAACVTYALAFEPSGVRLLRGEVADADVTLHHELATARLLAQGLLAPRTALSDGRLRVHGRPSRLLDAVEAFAAVAAATASLRNETSFAG